ncbi:DUF362 domain-containing protein [Candidatus Poribacteria bacterium]|nr:DUF362 domain-containing protein [Candidatus Poribacteria bacterium]MYB66418.1 DUF362 domain-containing protein [Candidatus Poribacteria bacterium]
MSDTVTKVGLAKTGRRRSNVYEALNNIREEITPKVREQVLLKPNFLSSTNQLASSHVDAMRGALDFLMSTPEPPKEVIIAEGANESFSGEAFQIFGYDALQAEYDIPIRLVDLHEETEWVETKVFLSDRESETVRMPKTVLDCPCTISVAIAKTHDACVVTLAMKNMIMGTIHKTDRIKVHGYLSHGDRALPREAQTININLLRLSRFLRPDIAIVDGTLGLQGNGPGGTNSVQLGIAVASGDVFAADAVTSKAMGFEPMDIGLFNYANELGYGTANLDNIEIIGPDVGSIAIPFKPHETAELQLQWHDEESSEYLAAD